MIKIFNRILWGIKPPENKSDIWFDGDVFKIYRKGDWEAITIEIDAASKLADVIKNINDVYQTKLTEGDGILLEDSKISVRRMFQVVDRLPKIGEYNTIYLLVENNKEIGSYIYINNEWMSLVSTIEIDKNLNIYSTNPVENKAVTKKIESLDVVRIVEGGVSGLESGNFRDGSVGSAISSDHAFSGITLTREHVGCTIQGVKWIYWGGLTLFPNFGVNTSCTINLRNNYGDRGSIKMYYKDITSLDIDIILPNEHITLMKDSVVFLPENVNTVLTNKLAYYQIVGIYNNGFDVDSFAPYFQFDLTRDIRTLYFKNGDWKKVLIEDNVKTINGHSILGDGNIVVEGGEGGSGIYEIKYDYLNENLLSGEDIAFNKEVFNKLNKNKVSALYVTINIDNTPVNIVADSFVYAPPPDGGSLSCVYLTFSSDALTNLGLQKKTVTILSNGQCTGMPISSNIVDDELSDTSKNAVQNKVITEELNNKVDKVRGKQLSTEDFTANDKQKLDGLSNYDDTEIKESIEEMFAIVGSHNKEVRFFCIEPVTVKVGDKEYYCKANQIATVFVGDENFEIIPTSNRSIQSLLSYPIPLVWHDWLEGVEVFEGIVFDMNELETYHHWIQYYQDDFHVQKAQYANCVFWSDKPYTHSPFEERTNYTIYYSSQLPLCYSRIPENTYKPFYMAYGVNSDPNWRNPDYINSFANVSGATQTFSYYGASAIGIFDMAVHIIPLPKDCRGLMYHALAIQHAGVFDASNTTNFGAKKGSWQDAFGDCISLTSLYIQNLKASINLSWSPISTKSLEYIVNNASNTSKITISLSPYTWYRLTDEIRTAASSKNIALELITTNYVDDSRWATKQDTIADLDTIRSGASLGATALQTVPKGYATETWVSTEIAKAQLEGEGVDPSEFATKDDIKGLATKEETEAVKTWVNEQGFLTEHQDITGKQDAIDDLEAIREGAAKGATALQSYTEKYKGTVTGIKVNGSTHNPSNGVVDLGTISADGSLRIHFEPNFDLEIGQHIDVTSLVQQSMGITPAELYEEVVTNGKKTALFIHELMGGELQEISRVTDSLYEGVRLSYLSTLEGLPSPFQLIISPTQCQLVIVDILAGYNSVVVPLTEMIEGKQDVINDLDAIRSGAEKGATALQEHQSLEGYATESFVNDAISTAITNTINASY